MFLRSRVQSITGSVRTQKWERRRKDGRPESCVGSYELPGFHIRFVCGRGGRPGGPRATGLALRSPSHAHSSPPHPGVETGAVLSQRHVRAALNQSSAAAEVSAGIQGD